MSDITDANSLKETIKWKNSIDESVNFIDGAPLPCLLIQNKCDLLKSEPNEREINKFTEDNKFISNFQTSAKCGINVNESMEFMIKTIVERMENFSDGKEEIKNPRESILIQSKYSQQLEYKKNCC